MRSQEERDFWSHALGSIPTLMGSTLAPVHAIAALGGGALLALLPSGPYAAQFAALLGLVILDMLLGTLRGLVFSRRGWDSRKFQRGLVKTTFVLAIPLALYWTSLLDKETGQIFRTAASIMVVWFGGYEMLSIVRNAGRCGIPIPSRLLKTIEGTLDSAENENKGKSE